MSNAINYIMGTICGVGAIEIPRQILEEVFKDEWLERNMPTSLEDRIFQRVIRPRVMMDINMYMGQEIVINLQGSDVKEVDHYTRIYRLTPAHTNNREIITAACIVYIPAGSQVYSRSSMFTTHTDARNNDFLNYAAMQVDSVSSIPIVHSTRVEVVGYNTIRVYDRAQFKNPYALRAYVTHDNKLSSIPPTAYMELSELCILAVKAYCYNQMVITQGDNFLRRGMELGVFKDIVQRWEDCATQYKEYFKENWKVQGQLMNEDRHHGHLQMLTRMGG